MYIPAHIAAGNAKLSENRPEADVEGVIQDLRALCAERSPTRWRVLSSSGNGAE